MAKQMSFESKNTGETCAEGYWTPQLMLIPFQKFATIDFSGFFNHQARLDGKSPLASKAYAVTKDEFDEYFSSDVQSQPDMNPQKACYLVAMNRLDTPTGDLDEEGNPVMGSFFAKAADV